MTSDFTKDGHIQLLQGQYTVLPALQAASARIRALARQG
jgi:hypothetical protein